MATSKPGLTRGEDLRRQKELDEARKAGLAPAAVDEHGKEINPHIPQYMASAPWYAVDDASKPTLRHQRDWRQDEEGGGGGAAAAGASAAPGQPQGQWYDRGAKGFQASKYRKGACENCGAMTHKTTDCLERPRARGARWTDKHIAADEKVQEVKLAGWDAKRDRWNGYDPAEHDRVVQRYERVEALRQEARAQQRLAALVSGGGGDEGGSGGGVRGSGGGGAAAAAGGGAGEAAGEAAEAGEAGTSAAAAAAPPPPADDVRLADEEALGFGAVERRVAAPGGGATGSVRNLRIREDTAKYLLNLDVNSAHYDPKTRSMREDPLPHKPAHEKPFAGDNFVRTSGAEYEAWAALERHALQAYEKGAEVHAQALPSLAETMYASFKAKKEALVRKQRSDVRERYGSAAANPAEDLPEGAAAADPEARRALLMGQSEAYVEYDPRTGRVVRGAERPVARSRYEEDVHPGNHTSVWGSWWSPESGWGYSCCRQNLRNSYCTGREGARAAEQGAEQMARNLAAKAREDNRRAEAERRAKSTLSNAHLEKGGKEGGAGGDGVWGGEAPTGEGELELDPEKLQRALEREDRRAAKQAERERAAAAEAEEKDEEQGGRRRAARSRAEEREKLLRKRRGEAGGGGSDDDDDSDDDGLGEGRRAMTKEEMEAYRRKRARPDDPMVQQLRNGGGGGGAAGGEGGGGYDLLE
jgi:pre-mRNA-processing factor SLU7